MTSRSEDARARDTPSSPAPPASAGSSASSSSSSAVTSSSSTAASSSAALASANGTGAVPLPEPPKLTKKQKRLQQENDVLMELHKEEREKSMFEEVEDENKSRRWETRELRLRLAKHLQVQTQVIEQLRVYLDAKHLQIKDLTKENRDLHQSLQDDIINNQKELQNMLFSHDEQKKQIIAETVRLREDNEIMLKYENEKEMLKNKLAQYRIAIDREKKALKKHLEQLDMRNVMEKDALKNEMLRKIRETKLSLLEMTQDQLHATTKRTIRENEMMTTELQYQSKQCENIARKNSKMTQINKQVNEDLRAMQQEKKQLALQAHVLQTVVTNLNAKIAQLETALHTAAELQRHFHTQRAKALAAAPSPSSLGLPTSPSSSQQQQQQQQQRLPPLPGASPAPPQASPTPAPSSSSSSSSLAAGDHQSQQSQQQDELQLQRQQQQQAALLARLQEQQQQSLANLSVRALEVRVADLQDQLALARTQVAAATEAAVQAHRSCRISLVHLDDAAVFILEELDRAWREILQRREQEALGLGGGAGGGGSGSADALTAAATGASSSSESAGGGTLRFSSAYEEAEAKMAVPAYVLHWNRALNDMGDDLQVPDGIGGGSKRWSNQKTSGSSSRIGKLSNEDRWKLIDAWFAKLSASSAYSQSMARISHK